MFLFYREFLVQICDKNCSVELYDFWVQEQKESQTYLSIIQKCLMYLRFTSYVVNRFNLLMINLTFCSLLFYRENGSEKLKMTTSVYKVLTLAKAW